MKIINNIKNFIIRNWFFIAIIILFIIKCILINEQIVYVRGSSHDDSYFAKAAFNLANGSWLGKYDDIILSKGITGIAFIALTKILGGSFLHIQSFIYFLSCISIIHMLSNLIKNKKILLILYTLLLFNPISYSSHFNYIYRDGIYTILIMFLISFSFQIYFNKDKSIKRYTIYTILYGITTTAILLCREETLCVSPFIIGFISIIVLSILLSKKSKIKIFKILLITLVPLLTYYMATSYIGTKNHIYYNRYIISDFTSKDFQDLYGALTRIKQENYILRVPLNRETRYKLYELSPTFNELKETMEGEELKKYYKGRKPRDFQEGFLYWAVRYAAKTKGYYKDAQTSYNFNVRLTNEINNLCDSGKLECGPKRSSLVAPLNKEMIKEYIRLIPTTIERQVTYSNVLVKWEQRENIPYSIEKITNSNLYYENENSIRLTIMQIILKVYKVLNPILVFISIILYFKVIIYFLKNKFKHLDWIIIINGLILLYALRLAAVNLVASCEYIEALSKSQYLLSSYNVQLLFCILIILLYIKIKKKKISI